MQLLIFLGHSGTSCTLYNVILKTWVVNSATTLHKCKKGGEEEEEGHIMEQAMIFI